MSTCLASSCRHRRFSLWETVRNQTASLSEETGQVRDKNRRDRAQTENRMDENWRCYFGNISDWGLHAQRYFVIFRSVRRQYFCLWQSKLWNNWCSILLQFLRNMTYSMSPAAVAAVAAVLPVVVSVASESECRVFVRRLFDATVCGRLAVVLHERSHCVRRGVACAEHRTMCSSSRSRIMNDILNLNYKWIL